MACRQPYRLRPAGKFVCNTVKCFARRSVMASWKPASVSQTVRPRACHRPTGTGAVGMGEETAVGTDPEKAVAIEGVGAGIRQHGHIAFTVM